MKTQFEFRMLWKGKPIQNYSKEELIDIVEDLCERIEAERAQHERDLDDSINLLDKLAC